MNINDYKKVTDRIEISERCRDEVLNMAKRSEKRNHKIKIKTVPIIIAATVAACGGTAVFAANHFGLFDRLNKTMDSTTVNEYGVEVKPNKYDNNNYEIIGQNAEELTEPVNAVSKNISIGAQSVYCDGSSLIIGLTGSLSDGNTMDFNAISFLCDVNIGGTVYTFNAEPNRDVLSSAMGLYRDEGEQNSFTGSISIAFKKDNKITEQTTADIRIYNILCGNNRYSDSAVTLDDEINLTVDINPETELVQEYLASMSDNGFEAKIYEISPAMITVGTRYPEFYDTNIETITIDGYEAPKYSLITLWYDENGNQIDFLSASCLPDYNDGFETGMLSSTDSSTLTVKWFNKQVQDENGNMELLYEYTFDLTE